MKRTAPGETWTATATVQVRFCTSDPGNNSITEAGIDLFQVTRYTRTTVPACACPGDLTGDRLLDGNDIPGPVSCYLSPAQGCDCADMDASGGPPSQADLTAFVTALLDGNLCQP